MILGFKEKFPWGESTYFRENILLNTKIHAILEDRRNRWKAGMGIQMVYRGGKYFFKEHFSDGIPRLERCLGVQKIQIKNCNNIAIDDYVGIILNYTLKNEEYQSYIMVYIDDKPLNKTSIMRLAKNEGFDSVEQFLRCFKSNFTGKIIHWTNHLY